jgi:ATP-dependent Clp protease ATP-binding subunit ClpA
MGSDDRWLTPRPSELLDRFSAAARRALARAPDEMKASNDAAMRPEHLLVALLRDERSVAYLTVAQFVDPPQLLDGLRSVVVKGPPDAPRRTPPVKLVISAALTEAEAAGSPVVNTGHLLLALLDVHEAAATNLLSTAGIDVMKLRGTLPSIEHLAAEASGA